METRLSEYELLPVDIQCRMLECQVEQGNKKDRNVFIDNMMALVRRGGFDWKETLEGEAFWYSVITWKNYKTFFDKYPKKSLSENAVISVHDNSISENSLIAIKKQMELDNYDNGLNILKSIAPNIFKNPVLEEGKWYKVIDNSGTWSKENYAIVKYYKGIECTGFDFGRKGFTEGFFNLEYDDTIALATEEEVKQCFRDEFIRRGFTKGKVYYNSFNEKIGVIKDFKFDYLFTNNAIYNNGRTVYRNGKLIEFRDSIPLSEL